MKFALIMLAGIFAGFVNVVSGGGSFVTIPALTFLGLGLDVANGTNRVAILLQNVVAVWKFWKVGVLDPIRAARIAAPTVLGAVLGARIAVGMDRDLLKRLVGVVLLSMVYFVVKRSRTVESGSGSGKSILVSIPVFFAVGIYGGFIQAGVGFFLLSALLFVEGMGISEGNAYKVFTILVYTPFALWVFLSGGKVDIVSGLVLSIGNVLGANLGVKLAVSGEVKWMRYILVSMMVISAILFISGV